MNHIIRYSFYVLTSVMMGSMFWNIGIGCLLCVCLCLTYGNRIGGLGLRPRLCRGRLGLACGGTCTDVLEVSSQCRLRLRSGSSLAMFAHDTIVHFYGLSLLIIKFSIFIMAYLQWSILSIIKNNIKVKIYVARSIIKLVSHYKSKHYFRISFFFGSNTLTPNLDKFIHET